MKLINRTETENYIEIEIEKRFLFWTYSLLYRKFNRSIFLYSPPNNYKLMGLFSHSDISPFFNIKITENEKLNKLGSK